LVISAYGEPGSASRSRRPNILIAIADDWSFPHAGAYGNSWIKTPHFDRIAREGVLFRNAYTPVAKCAASRASLLLGRNPWQSGAAFTHWNYFPPEYRTFPEALGANGYFTGFTGKGWSPGVALTAAGAPRSLLGRTFQTRKLTPPTTGIASVDYAGNFADFLAAAPAGTPWFFWYGGNEPHREYEFKSGVIKGGKSLDEIDRVPGQWPDHPDVRHDLLDYAMEIEHFDSQLGAMLRELERRGELENTIVIVTSDNGMPFPRAKGQAYEAASHLPLAIRWPAGIPHPGRTVTDFVTFPDVAPTLLAAAGIDPAQSGLAAISGRSLLALLASTQSGRIESARDHALLGRERHDPGRPRNAGYPVRGIVTDRFLYLHNFAPERWPSGNPETGYLDTDKGATRDVLLRSRRTSGVTSPHWELNFGLRPAEELYALAVDPDNVRNLAARPDQATHLSALRKRLFAALRAQGDPRLTSDDPVFFDRFPFANPDFNDLYERWQRKELKLPHWADPEPASLPRPGQPAGTIHIDDLVVHDPQILADEKTRTYYLYGQYAPDRKWVDLGSRPDRAGLICYTSTDLEYWSRPKLVFEVPADFWADKQGAPWAPEVHEWRGRYYAFVTFNDWQTKLEENPSRPPITKRQVQILVAESPLGPFRPHSPGPVTPPGEMTLDGSFFVDEQGSPWLLYAHEWIQTTDGSFKAMRLNDELTATIGQPLEILRASVGPWTKREISYKNQPPVPGIVTDGPCLYRMQSGKLAFFWASWSKDRLYAEAISYSDTGKITGPWRHSDTPILQDDVGHGSVFRAFDGRLLFVVHKYFKQPATRVQIYELSEHQDRIDVVRQILGTP
jgi:arylsulfatase A-like enzyme